MLGLITRLKNDHEHGSREIAQFFLLDCRAWCSHHLVDPEQFLDFLNQVETARQSMVIFQNITHRLRKLISLDREGLGRRIVNEINLLLKELALSERLILERTRVFCQSRNIHSVLTHSRSSTVESVLKQLGKSKLLSSVFCTESRPLNEGAALANALTPYIHTTLIVDALADSIVRQCDCVFLGADAMDKQGYVLNKIGSRLIALSAKDHGIPIICLVGSMKIHPTKRVASLPLELQPSAELGHLLNNNLSVINQYFEVVEKDLFSAIISDQELIN